jgi:hypothetical protein
VKNIKSESAIEETSGPVSMVMSRVPVHLADSYICIILSLVANTRGASYMIRKEVVYIYGETLSGLLNSFFFRTLEPE